MKMYNRCMGECCKDIGLKISPEEFKGSYLKWVLNSGDANIDTVVMTVKNEDIKIDRDLSEIYLLYPMLTYIKKDYCHPESDGKKQDCIIYHYTCKHFDNKNKVCTIYNIRPYMCRSYPNSKFCRNPKCKWDKQIKLREKYNKQKLKSEVKNEK